MLEVLLLTGAAVFHVDERLVVMAARMFQLEALVTVRLARRFHVLLTACETTAEVFQLDARVWVT